MFHNVIDQQRIRRLAEEPGGFSDAFEGLRLLTVGRLTHQKAYDVAIQAMARLKASGACVRWYVLGEGSRRTVLERQIAACGLQKDFCCWAQPQTHIPTMRRPAFTFTPPALREKHCHTGSADAGLCRDRLGLQRKPGADRGRRGWNFVQAGAGGTCRSHSAPCGGSGAAAAAWAGCVPQKAGGAEELDRLLQMAGTGEKGDG